MKVSALHKKLLGFFFFFGVPISFRILYVKSTLCNENLCKEENTDTHLHTVDVHTHTLVT